MSAILNPTSIVYCDDSLSVNNRAPIVAEIWCGDASDLPDPEDFAGYILITGSKSICANGDEYGLDGSSWVLHDQSPFSNVYTKSETYSRTEVNNITDGITAAYRSADETIWKYIYELLLVSDLNLCSVHSGSSTGYFVQDLPVSLPPGDYIWKFKRDGSTQTSMRVKAADDTSLYNVTRGAGVNDFEQPFTVSDTGAKLSIYTGSGINITYCAIYKVIE